MICNKVLLQLIIVELLWQMLHLVGVQEGVLRLDFLLSPQNKVVKVLVNSNEIGIGLFRGLKSFSFRLNVNVLMQTCSISVSFRKQTNKKLSCSLVETGSAYLQMSSHLHSQSQIETDDYTQ